MTVLTKATSEYRMAKTNLRFAELTDGKYSEAWQEAVAYKALYGKRVKRAVKITREALRKREAEKLDN